MDSDTDHRSLGEYQLRELVAESPQIRRWLAEQVSVGRMVLLDELKPEQEAMRADFLADVRAKAAVDHPLVGSVYEAVAQADTCFFAHELLPGSSLHDYNAAAATMKPMRLAHVIRRLADAQIHQESAGIATSPLALQHIHLDDHGVIRIENLAVSGARLPDHTTRDIARMGERLQPLVADGQPGTTRLLTLLAWMRGQGIEKALSWQQVRDISTQIEQQLGEPIAPAAATRAASREKSKSPMVWIAGFLGLAAIITAVAVLKKGSPPDTQVAAGPLPQAVLIPAGEHPTPDGTVEPLQAFRISAHEVTISEYSEFLETLKTLAKDQRERTFDHEDQPAEKTSHVPDDWENLLAAARAGSAWNGRPATMDSPIVGVDWWDCAAYAEWKQARLPTQEEWFAALRKDVEVPAGLVPSPWQSVTATNTDRTPQGILGLAGSVAEWTRRPAINPANPIGERKWLIIGGSYLRPGSNALTREWVDERSLRRPDLGFRLVFDAK